MSSTPSHDHQKSGHSGHGPHQEPGPTDDAPHHPPHPIVWKPFAYSWLVGWVISGIVLLIALLGAITAFVLLRRPE